MKEITIDELTADLIKVNLWSNEGIDNFCTLDLDEAKVLSEYIKRNYTITKKY